MPRNRAGEFEPQIVPKHAHRVEGFDEADRVAVCQGPDRREIRAHLAEIYHVEGSRDLISRVTDKVMAELERPLDAVYPVVPIDALYVKIREGNVANRPVYVAVGINCV